MLAHEPETHFQMMAGVLRDKSQKYKKDCLSTLHWAYPRCNRRLQQMVNAVRFMSKAQGNSRLAKSMTEEDRQAQQAAYDAAIADLSGVLGEDGLVALRLKDKIQASPSLKKDPEGTVKKMMSLLTRLTMGSEEEKAAAKAEVESMPSSSPALSPEEEAEAEEKGRQLLAEVRDVDSDTALDDAELVTESDDEEGASLAETSALTPVSASALEVRRLGAMLSSEQLGSAASWGI
ncbi:unnamed protein product, partial [Symbiodinium necroappetens]